MINEISLENFKSWKKIEKMRFAPITGLFGTNSSGKTSILQWLLLQKQTVESSDRRQVLNLGNEHSFVNLGTLRDVMHGRAEFGDLAWSTCWTFPEFSLYGTYTETGPTLGNTLRFDCRIAIDENVPLTEFGYQLSSHEARCVRSENGPRYKLEVLGPIKVQTDKSGGRNREQLGPKKFYGFPDGFKATVDDGWLLPELELQFEALFARLYYLGPLREYPQREYYSGKPRPGDVGHRGENVVDALLSSRSGDEPRMLNGKLASLEEITAFWLRELKLIHEILLSPIDSSERVFQVLVRKTAFSPSVPITDVGFGISQILPVIVLCYYVPKGSIIIFEQPEIHLHPSAQAGLADVFIDAMKTRGIQIILESHSEHLLRRLQRRIAEDTLSNKQVALYFCEYEKDQSHLNELDVDTYGNIKNWPEDFFGDEMGELSAMTIAAMDRQIKEKGR